jgi:paraquat-inducible protein B
MSTPEDQTNAPETGRRRTIWPNLVWGIPLAALAIVGYLGVRALLNRGEVVTVTFTRAAGAKAGVTKVLYHGIEAGQVTKIEPNADGRRLDFPSPPGAGGKKWSEYQCSFLADRGESQLY